ncbi:MAG: hypothetical protein WDM86_22765 [Rhizomicrobium sp.]
MTQASPCSEPRKRGRPRQHPPKLPSPRGRGAQPGNQNRRRHGRYSEAMRAAKAALKDEIAKIEALVAGVCAADSS